MTHRHGRICTRHGAAVAAGLVCAALPATALAPAGAATSAPGTGDRPAVTGFRLRPSTLRPPVDAAFRFFTSREGAGSITLARLTPTGRLVAAGRLRFAVDAGDARRPFDGRVAGRRLAPGRYRATLTVTNADTGPSLPRRLTFRVVA